MTLDRDLDRRLVLLLDERAVAAPPADLLERSLARVDATRQRPGLLAGALVPRRTVSVWRTVVPAWVALALVALIAIAVVAVGARLIFPSLVLGPTPTPALTADATPRATDPIPADTEAPPTSPPGPLGGGPILAQSWTGSGDPGPFEVVSIDPSTGTTTLLGRMPKGGGCCGYPFLRNAGLSRVVILGVALQDATTAAAQFGFVSVTGAAAEGEWTTLSPAGDFLAAIRPDSQDKPIDIVVGDFQGTVQARLPIPSGMSWGGPLSWAPDGQSLLLTGCKPCNQAETPTQKQTAHHAHIYVVPLDGSDWRELLDLDNGQLNEWWSPDGTRLAVERYPCAEGSFMPRCDPAETLDSLSVLDPTTGAETTLVDDVPMISAADWSPDGTRIAFGALDGAYVVDIASGRLTKVDAAQTWSADWSPDGQWLVINHEGRGADVESVIVRADGSQTGIVLNDYTGVTW